MSIAGRIRALVARSDPTPTFPNWGAFMNWLTVNGHTYALSSINQTLRGDREEIGSEFASLVTQAFMSNTVVYACEVARIAAFSEARFQWRRMQQGRPGELFGDASLAVLEYPWDGAVTGDLLARLLLYADFGGTGFAIRSARNRAEYNRIRVPRPDWITMVMGSDRNPDDPAIAVDADLLAILYHPGGPTSGYKPEVFLPGEFAIFAPIPDPLARYRGIPWPSVAAREIAGDNSMTEHKRLFMANGATPNMVVTLDPSILQAEFDAWVDAFKEQEPTGAKSYKTLYLGGGAKVDVVGVDFQKLEFKSTQGAGETRIAAAAGVHPVIAGLSEGLAGSSLNAGNFAAAKRRFVDLTVRPLWRNACGSLQTIVPPPVGAMLWYDDRDIPFLREDAKDRAEIQSMEAQTIRTLIDSGWEPDSIISAVRAEDWTRLTHSGLYSVQLQPPTTATVNVTPAPAPALPAPGRESLWDLLEARERRMAEAPAPVINVHPAPVDVSVNVPEQPVTVTFERGAFELAAPEPDPAPAPDPVVTDLEYDADGRVVRITESPA